MTVGLRLPHPNRRAALNQLKMEFGKPTESPMTREAKKVSGAVKRHLEGGKPDLAGIELDMTGVQPFSRSVYEFVRSIKAGETLTYGQVAEAIGNPGAARAVGQALGRNPFAIIVPCHRVVGSGGRIGGFSAAGGASTKMSLLEIEGAPLRKISDRPTGDFRRSYSATKAISHLKATDVRMGQLIESVGPYSMELRDTPSTFSSLTEAIVHQQLNGKAALAIHGRLCGLFPRSSDGPGPRQILRSSDEQLRSAGLSMSKILALRDLAERTIKGQIPTVEQSRSMDDEDIIAKMVEVRGIGRWTAEMFLIFTLGRPDVFPSGDFGIRKGFTVLYGLADLPAPKELEGKSEIWVPYRSVASWYLWQLANDPTIVTRFR